jgi:HPt (histidine-containing phosphotransfer) domain-containing protein
MSASDFSALPRVNESTLEDLLGPDHDTEMLRDLAGVFFKDSPIILARITDSLHAGDPARLERAAHSLKGSSAAMGADRLSAVCRALEDAAATHEVNEARRLAELCIAEFRAVSVELARRAGVQPPVH